MSILEKIVTIAEKNRLHIMNHDVYTSRLDNRWYGIQEGARRLARFDIIIQLIAPLVSFWALGHGDLFLLNTVLPGEWNVWVFFLALLGAYILYVPAVVQVSMATVPAITRQAVPAIGIPLLTEAVILSGVIGGFTEQGAWYWAMFIGVHMFCATTIATIFHLIKHPALRPVWFQKKWILFLFVLISLVAIVGFQLIAVPTYLSIEATFFSPEARAVIWFAGLFVRALTFRPAPDVVS